MRFLSWCNEAWLGAAVPIALLAVGLWYVIRLRGWIFLHPVRLLRAVMQRQRTDGISPWAALSMALAGVLGVGNLVGVSAAIAAGGAGAIFWMWVSATVAMLLKYAEIVLAVRHRRLGRSGGGAMYYVRDAFSGRFPWLGRLLAGVFALLCLANAFSMGCVLQINAVASAWEGLCGVPPLVTGLVLALGVLGVALGGARGISRLTERVVPLLTLGFVAVSLLAIGRCADRVPALLRYIVRDALEAKTDGSFWGGVGGFLLSRSLRFGTMRGLLSNEAGCGTSPMAHAEADTGDAVAQGCLGVVEVFVDTHLLCSMTALVVLLAWDKVSSLGDTPMLMTVCAYEHLLGRGAGAFLAVAVLLFGFATLLCWAHYACRSLTFLVGAKGRTAGVVRGVCLALYGLFCVVGALAAPTGVWTVADFAIGVMTLLNLAALLKLQREVVTVTREAMSARRKRGEHV